jgi:hypothetical protein
MKRHRGNPGLRGRLLSKSMEAYVLALETINRLSVKYRIEAFAYLVCNAWELLLKAKILVDGRKRSTIYYPKVRKQKRRTLALRDCIKRLLLNEKDPTRLNLEHIADLRDDAVHMVIEDVPPDVMGLFQACVINYHKHLGEWFGVSLRDRVPVGMMTLVCELDPAQFNLATPALRRRLGKETVKYLQELQAKIQQMHAELGRPAEFAIGVEYKLALTKKPEAADIVLTSGPGGSGLQFVEVPKDPSKTHPHRQKEILAKLNATRKGQKKLNPHDLLCVKKVYNVKSRPDFFYQGTVPGNPAQYSEAFAAWLLKQLEKEPDFFVKCREKAKDCSKGKAKGATT